MTGQHVIAVLGQTPGEGDDINGGWSAVVLCAPPCFPLDLLLSQTTAGPTERGTKHDSQAEAQHGHKDLKYREVHQQPGMLEINFANQQSAGPTYTSGTMKSIDQRAVP